MRATGKPQGAASPQTTRQGNTQRQASTAEPLEPLVGRLLTFAHPRYEEQFWQEQAGRRIALMHRWAPRTDPLLLGILLALHATLLLRLALLGGLERLPLPLAGAYLSLVQLRMAPAWPVGWVRVRALLLPATQLLLAASVATSAGGLAAAALGPAGDGHLQQTTSAVVQAGSGLAQLAWGMLRVCGGGLQRVAALALDSSSRAALAAPFGAAAAAVQQVVARSSLAGLWRSGSLRVLLSECTSFWVLVLAALPHPLAQPFAVAVWVQLAAAAMNIATCGTTCAAALEGRPCLQRQYQAAAAFMQQAMSAFPLPSAAIAAGRSPAQAAPSPQAACCAVKAFAWLTCCWTISLRRLYRHELEDRLAWSRRQRWPAERLTQQLRWMLVPLMAAAAEVAIAIAVNWHIAAVML